MKNRFSLQAVRCRVLIHYNPESRVVYYWIYQKYQYKIQFKSGFFNMRIILTGPKGAGKTTLGKKTAKYLDLPFFDMDREVAGFTFKDVQSREKHEFDRLDHLTGKEKFFISTGWRTFINKKCVPFLNSGNFIVLLKADEKILQGRLKTGGETDYYDNFTHEEYLSAADEIYKTVESSADLIIKIDPYKKSGFHRFIGDEILKILGKGLLL